MLEQGVGIICGPKGCLRVSSLLLDWDDPEQRQLGQQFSLAYQAALRANRDPGKDHETLRLLALITTGTGQQRLPGL